MTTKRAYFVTLWAMFVCLLAALALPAYPQGVVRLRDIIPNCIDSAGQHLNYSTSSGLFVCGTSSVSAGSVSTSADLIALLSDETGSGKAVFGTSPTLTGVTINQAANGNTVLLSNRFTDTSPTGNFELFKNAAGSTLWNVDITGNLATGIVPVARVTGLAASATTDTTNAANVTGTGTFNTSGNAATATALAANGSNCSSGSAAGGVNASGVAEACTAYVQIGGDIGNTATSPQVTATHLSSPLPVAQGGTGTTSFSIPTAASKHSDQSVFLSTTLQPDTAISTPTLTTGTYSINIKLWVTCSTTGGIQWSKTSTATIAYERWHWQLFDQDGNIFGGPQNTFVMTVAGATAFYIEITGTVVITSPGSIVLQWAQAVSDATGTIVQAGSSIVTTPLS